MRKSVRVFAAPVILVTVALGLAVPARAETTRCTVIATLPATLTVQGIYCLISDFDLNLASGSAITINTNNVTIDLNGHKIGNMAAGPGTQARGISAVQRQNVTIK